jgi:hypothetical protein
VPFSQVAMIRRCAPSSSGSDSLIPPPFAPK